MSTKAFSKEYGSQIVSIWLFKIILRQAQSFLWLLEKIYQNSADDNVEWHFERFDEGPCLRNLFVDVTLYEIKMKSRGVNSIKF